MKRAFLVAAVAMVAWSASASDGVGVTNYSWLQLAPDAVTAFYGVNDGAPIWDGGASGGTHGPGLDASWRYVNNVRWGMYVWLPDPTFTNNGQSTYWTGVKLDQPRVITSVNVEMIIAAPFYIDASNNGVDWVTISDLQPGSNSRSVPVKTERVDAYQYVRVRFDGGTYSSSGNYGGPGLFVIEPVGSGTLVGNDLVNWANIGNFGQRDASNNLIPNFSASRPFPDPFGYWNGNNACNNWTDGTLRRDNPRPIAGKTAMIPYMVDEEGHYLQGDYLQIDLGAVRDISSVAVLFYDYNQTASFTLWVSETGNDDDFHPVTFELTAYGEGRGTNTAWCDFELEKAQFVRITDVTQRTNDGWYFNQVLVYGPAEVPPVPEPATVSLLALGGVALLRRRRVVER